MDSQLDPLLNEGTLRRALRLEVDERPPSLDASALAFAAARTPSRAALALAALVAATLLVAGIVIAVSAGEAVWAFAADGGSQSAVLGAGISLVVFLAVPAWDTVAALVAPSTAAVWVIAAALAVFLAGAQRREQSRADAS